MAIHADGFFPAKDNLRLFWVEDTPEVPRASVGLVHGYGDHLGRLANLSKALLADGFAVSAFDYRGHGQSDGRRGHCDAFSEYLDDLDLFWARLRKGAGPRKTFLWAHSHGGLMAALWAMRKPEGLAGLVLSSAYLGLAMKAPWYKVIPGKIVGRFVPWVPIALPIVPQQLSRDPEAHRALLSDPLYNRTLTPGWFSAAERAQAEVARRGADLKVPVFMYGVPKDPLVSSESNRRFFETIGSADKKFKEYPDRMHEPHNDFGKEEVFKEISSWISARL